MADTVHNSRVPRSMELYARAEQLIPGATQLISRWPTRVAYGVSPVYAASAKGARFRDVDGFEYIDWISGIGAIRLGYANPVVDDAVREQIATGTIYSVNHELEQTAQAALETFTIIRDALALGTVEESLECAVQQDAFRRLVR